MGNYPRDDHNDKQAYSISSPCVDVLMSNQNESFYSDQNSDTNETGQNLYSSATFQNKAFAILKALIYWLSSIPLHVCNKNIILRFSF